MTAATRAKQYRPPKSAWAAVDWSLPDGEIAGLMGVRRQAVSYQRRTWGKGSSKLTHPAERLRRWVAANRRTLGGLPSSVVRDRFAAETGLTLQKDTVRQALRTAGVPAYRVPKRTPPFSAPSRLATADWRLPTGDLAAIWGVLVNWVSIRRRRAGRPAKWRANNPRDVASVGYRRALEAERAKAVRR